MEKGRWYYAEEHCFYGKARGGSIEGAAERCTGKAFQPADADQGA